MALDRSNSKSESKETVALDETVMELRQKYTQDSLHEDEESSEKPNYQTSSVELDETESIVANTEEIALKALHVDDDPSLNPWTFRVFFLGSSIWINLSITRYIQHWS